MKIFVLALAVAVGFLLPQAVYAATTWFMPEGSTQGSFDLYILVNNPSSGSATVKYTFYTDSATITLDSTNAPTGFTSNCTIASGTRATLNVNSLATKTGFTGLSGKPISTEVESTNGVNIIAERAMYWSGTTMPWDAGHATRGVSGVEGCYIEIGQPTTANSQYYFIYISSPGSYKLISNITCTDDELNGIGIGSSNVTLDLNGFTITGPDVAGTYDGITTTGDSTFYNIIIKNGTVEKFGQHGISIGIAENILIDSVKCYANYSSGIYIGANTSNIVVQNCQLFDNASSGIELYSAFYTTARNNLCVSNDYGISLSGSSQYNRIEGNHFVNNTTDEIYEAVTSVANVYIYNTIGAADWTGLDDPDDEANLNDVGLNEQI